MVVGTTAYQRRNDSNTNRSRSASSVRNAPTGLGLAGISTDVTKREGGGLTRAGYRRQAAGLQPSMQARETPVVIMRVQLGLLDECAVGLDDPSNIVGFSQQFAGWMALCAVPGLCRHSLV